MSATTLAYPEGHRGLLAKSAAFVELSKPRIAALVLATVAAASYVARWGQPDLLGLIHTLIGVCLVVASASALNHWLERRPDALMPRTAGRPLPTGRLSNREVVLFAAITVAAGLVYLSVAVNVSAALWALLSWCLYAWIYTPLKTRTAWNTTVGAVAGALPVVIGWSATAAAADLRLIGMFCLLFLWQFPHFMAIAWLYRDQYDHAGLKMLTVVDPSGHLAGVQAASSALTLLPVSLAPLLVGPPGELWAYLAAAGVLGAALAGCAAVFLTSRSRTTARALLRASLLYLPLMLLLLVVVNSA